MFDFCLPKPNDALEFETSTSQRGLIFVSPSGIALLASPMEFQIGEAI
jgi:hypothetical protein